jgi:hypothetical protein
LIDESSENIVRDCRRLALQHKHEFLEAGQHELVISECKES